MSLESTDNLDTKKVEEKKNIVVVKKKRGRKPKKKTENKVEVPKKKRGRKPKKKNPEDLVKKVPKKRGRKPKPKDPNAPPKVLKKRGRKPKKKIYSVKELPKTFFEENKNETLILHLPLHKKDIDEYLNNNLLKYNPSLNIPKPFETDNSFFILENNTKTTNNFDNKILANKKNNLINKSLDNQIENELNNKNKKIIVEKKKSMDTDNKLTKDKLINIRYEFLNCNKCKKWPKKINYNCLWCCHKFDTMPISLPVKYQNDTFYMTDFFCSYNCAASYNFDKKDEKIWERYSLLNLFYKKVNNCEFKQIKLAPPRETLKIFGGHLSIEKYREELITQDKKFNVFIPPIISIIPKIEESLSYITNKPNSKLFVPVNNKLLKKAQNSLRLKRDNPIINQNKTLQSFMDLKIV